MVPEGFRILNVSPYLVVSDANAERAFLKNVFGATELQCHRDAENRVMHCELALGNALVMLGQANDQWKPLSAAIFIHVNDLETTYARALEAGAVSQFAPSDRPGNRRVGGVVDANGVTWWIAMDR